MYFNICTICTSTSVLHSNGDNTDIDTCQWLSQSKLLDPSKATQNYSSLRSLSAIIITLRQVIYYMLDVSFVRAEYVEKCTGVIHYPMLGQLVSQ